MGQLTLYVLLNPKTDHVWCKVCTSVKDTLSPMDAEYVNEGWTAMIRHIVDTPGCIVYLENVVHPAQSKRMIDKIANVLDQLSRDWPAYYPIKFQHVPGKSLQFNVGENATGTVITESQYLCGERKIPLYKVPATMVVHKRHTASLTCPQVFIVPVKKEPE